jgi:hypothetical protein
MVPPTCAEMEEWERKLREARQTAAEAERVAAEANEVAAQYEAAMSWAVLCVFALPELWGIIAEHSGFVGAWRLTRVCRASREGAKEWLRGDANVLRLWREWCPELRALWSADADVSTWKGVTLGGKEHGAEGRSVVKIELTGKGLTGAVPAALGRLAALKRLDLHNNQLTGVVPAALG